MHLWRVKVAGASMGIWVCVCMRGLGYRYVFLLHTLRELVCRHGRGTGHGYGWGGSRGDNVVCRVCSLHRSSWLGKLRR